MTSSGDPKPASGEQRGRKQRGVFGLIAAVAAVVVVAMVAWVALDRMSTGDAGEQGSAPSESNDGSGRGGSDRGGSDRRGSDQRGSGRPEAREQSKELTERLLSLQRREPGDPFARGEVDAPVVMIMYEDFRCPFCAKFANDVAPELEHYVESGKLRIEWRDFPIFGEQSMAMAKAGRAAGKQDKFWEFYEVAYSKATGRGKPSFPDERIRKVAKQAGVPDLEQFDQDRKDPQLRDEIARDLAEGRRIGVSSTPAFLINTQAVLGAQPVDVFESVIEQELEKA